MMGDMPFRCSDLYFERRSGARGLCSVQLEVKGNESTCRNVM